MASRDPDSPAGLYIHVPFCTGKCPYCSFCSGIEPLPGRIEDFAGALLTEIGISVPRGAGIGTIYAGGGTPSLLPGPSWKEILETLRLHCAVTPDCEATIEANPGGIGEDVFTLLADSGFNRISIGVQSLDARSLEVLGRRHAAGDSIEAVEAARSAGFENVSVDLIYGIPGQDEVAWRRDLLQTAELRPEHVSCYSLSFESGTPLAAAVEAGNLARPSDDLLAEMYLLADSILSSEGYEHYEVSNYSLGKGNRSRHNEGYWKGRPYFGLGPSAHGYDGAARRWWNVADLEAYVSHLSRGETPEEGHECLSQAQMLLERLMLGLRTSDGVELEEPGPGAERLISRWVAEGLCDREGSRMKPTPRGMLLADGMARDLSLAMGIDAGAPPGGTGRTGSPEP